MKGKKIMNNKKGITLIALVITIVVLLVLAGVAISMITGQEGLFSKANYSAVEYNNKSQNEATQFNGLMDYLNDYKENIITAEMVEFIPSDPNWKAIDGNNITNVKQALDYLYNN